MCEYISKMTWNVVHFIKAEPVETVEAIPTCWIIDNSTCYWPPYTGPKLKSSISKCENPLENWQKHEVRIIGKQYDNLNKARLKALRAETSSDINSDVETNKRHKIKNRRYIEDSESEEEILPGENSIIFEEIESSEEEITMKMPSLSQSSKQRNKIQKEAKISRSQSFITGTQDITSDSYYRITTPTTSRVTSDHVSNTTNTQRATAANTVTSDDTLNPRSNQDSFKKIVLRQLSLLNIKLDQLSEDVNYLRQNPVQNDTIALKESIINKFNFPLKTEADINEVEEYIVEKDISLQFVKKLSKIGGSNYKIMVKRIMHTLFTNKFAMEYSWIGFKSKKNFSVFHISRIIIDAVEKIHTNVTSADIEGAIKIWLVKAKIRENKSINN